jgi:hypothetical protein
MRVLFDTGDLRSLAGTYRTGGSTVVEVGRSTGSALGGVTLNPDDPTIRAARIHERHHHVRSQLDRIADEYRSDGRAFSELAAMLEGEQGGVGIGGIDTPMWLRIGAGSAGGALVAGVFGGTIGRSIVDALRRALRGLGLGGTGGGGASGPLGRAIGLATEAGSTFEALADMWSGRLRVFPIDLWSTIWGGMSGVLGSVLGWMRGTPSAANAADGASGGWWDRFTDWVLNRTEQDRWVSEQVDGVNPTGDDDNCVLCAIALERRLSGQDPNAAASSSDGGWMTIKKVQHDLNTAYPWYPAADEQEMRRLLLEWGPGSRAIINAERDGRPGHAFNVVNRNGKVVFLDGQKGREVDLSARQGYIRFQVIRTDPPMRF